MLTRSKILGHGYFLPPKVLKNEDLLTFVDTSDEWIFTRTGIKQRHVVLKDELTSDLAVMASKNALKSANLKIQDIDFLVPHQANLRIIEALSKKLDIPINKIINTVDVHANTSAASIPLAFRFFFAL